MKKIKDDIMSLKKRGAAKRVFETDVRWTLQEMNEKNGVIDRRDEDEGPRNMVHERNARKDMEHAFAAEVDEMIAQVQKENRQLTFDIVGARLLDKRVEELVLEEGSMHYQTLRKAELVEMLRLRGFEDTNASMFSIIRYVFFGLCPELLLLILNSMLEKSDEFIRYGGERATGENNGNPDRLQAVESAGQARDARRQADLAYWEEGKR